MVRRIYRARECLKYGRSVLVPRPCIKLKVMNAKSEEYPEELSFYVDTGFEGAILVTEDVYRFFEVGEIPRKYWRTYISLSGPIAMRAAKAIALVGDTRLETRVETPLVGKGKLLVGRELLKDLILVLDGPREEVCISEMLK